MNGGKSVNEADLLREAERAVADGDCERVRDLFSVARSGALTEEGCFYWWLVLVEAGIEEAASELARLLGATSFAERVVAISGGGDSGYVESEGEDDLLDFPLAEVCARSHDEVVIDLFLRWFGGRRDLYARQWYDEQRRRSGYRPVEEPLTPEVVRAHLEGRITIGQYLLFPDSCVSYGVLDIDLTSAALEEFRASRGGDLFPFDHPVLRSYVLRLIEAAGRIGLVLFPEDSGNRGIHLWLFFEPRRPARAARFLLGQVLVGAGPQPPEVCVEIFPKQERVGQKGFSSLVKLPLGVHQVTMRRCLLLDEGLRPIEDARVALERLRAPPADLVADVLGRRVALLPAPELEVGEVLPPLPRQTSARSLAEAMRSIKPGREEREACERILAGCAVVRRLVTAAYEHRRLAPAEARALLYTVGLVGPSCRLIEEIFAVAQVSRKELERVRRGLPSPAGCRRLKEVDPAGGADCTCCFGDLPQPYATPVLYAVGAKLPGPPTWEPFAPWIEEVPFRTADPLEEIASWLRRIEQRIERLERGGV